MSAEQQKKMHILNNGYENILRASESAHRHSGGQTFIRKNNKKNTALTEFKQI